MNWIFRIFGGLNFFSKSIWRKEMLMDHDWSKCVTSYFMTHSISVWIFIPLSSLKSSTLVSSPFQTWKIPYKCKLELCLSVFYANKIGTFVSQNMNSKVGMSLFALFLVKKPGKIQKGKKHWWHDLFLNWMNWQGLDKL